MTTLKLTSIGNSVGAIFPKEMLTILNSDKGDTLYVTRTPNGFEISPYNEKFARQMQAGRKVMRENRDALRKLAE